MTNILGFTSSVDSGAALIQDKKILHSVNEERLKRQKLFFGTPFESIELVLKLNGLKKEDIDIVTACGFSKGMTPLNDYTRRINALKPASLAILPLRYAFILQERAKIASLDESTAKKLFPNAKFSIIDHHLGHAASAFYTSGWKKAITITADGWGDSLSNGAYACNGKEIKLIHSSSELDSVGYFYGRVTTALGFKFHRHEGKITGLAAFGKPLPQLLEKMKKMIWFNKKEMRFDSSIDSMNAPFGNHFLQNLKIFYSKFKREDVACSAQQWLEQMFSEYVEAIIQEQGSSNIALSGGVFANVALNKAIKQVQGVKEIYIHPHMGDGGLGFAGAIHSANIEQNFNERFDNVYFGPKFSEQEIKKSLQEQNCRFEKIENIEMQIAELLNKGKIIARFDGRMEYGPRALGNRTIMYHTEDPKVNKWLNDQLHRNEFMPFAPVTLEKFAEKCYNDFKGAEHTAKFMTITFDCTKFMKESSPAVVHVDNTARPQIISKEINPSYYKIVDEYRKITGIPSLVNTSFNMHEEPIVCSPQDAIRAFKLGNLDYLAIGKFLAKN